jgi:glycosyltransferase involved in cell wall biosynthesis
MRILSLTAGAAQMYCGTCMRDNALASELIRQGHDVVLIPMYTPTKTDEENVSYERVFFGGISVYLQQNVALFRHLPAWLDRIWDSSWMLKLATSGSIPVDPKVLGEMTVSMLKGEEGFQRKEVRKLVTWLSHEVPPDVIDLPYTLFIGLAKPLKEALKRPVVCTLQGEDLFLNGLKEPWRSQCLELIRSQTQHVDRFIAVSAYYAVFMQEYLGIARDKIVVVPLGINMDGHSAVERTATDKLRIGYFARIAPEKGLDILCEAVSRMTEPVELRAAGYLPPEQKTWLETLQRHHQLSYEGSPDRAGKIRFLQSIDVLSVPTRYVEPKGFFVLEAMANGAPVVQPRHGAYVEIIGHTGGGILVEPNDPKDLAGALDELARDRIRLRQLAEQAAKGVRERYRIELMAERTLEVYRSVSEMVGAGARFA